MIHAKYIGEIEFLQGESALIQPTDDPTVIKVQVDRFEHPWSHGWHLSLAKEWRPDPDE
jgi:hypothetical protein